MEIILKKDVNKLGKALDVLKVKDGFARNFLIPQGIALPATEGNKRSIEQQKAAAAKREESKLKDARAVAKKIEEIPCTIPVKVKNDEEIFGSVSSHEIVEFLAKEGYTIERSAVELEEPIKLLGVYNIKIKLAKDVYAKLKVWVVKEEN